MITPEVVDLFCGAGGTSTGIVKAFARAGVTPRLTAVNHWPVAINTHSLNHPQIHHLCEPVENIHPLDHVKSGRLHILAASCECRYHSNARGGGPCNEQSRSQAWQLIRWATDLDVVNILVENVPEFEHWGPLHSRTKRPIKSKRGQFFRSFVETLRQLGYAVEYRKQCCADFGDATTRVRLVLIARKNKPITWPEPTHGAGRSLPHKPAREIIDWSILGKSLRNRPRPLCSNTMRRIEEGLKALGGPNAEPYLVILRGTSNGHLKSSFQSLNEPLPAVTASGNHMMLVEPFVIGQQSGAVARSVGKPLPTVSTAGAIRLVQPIIVQTDQTSRSGHCARSVEDPLPTVVSKQNLMLVEPMVMKYYKTGVCKSVDAPLDTVTTKARFLLVQPQSGPYFDLLTRMLEPHELAAAHSFPSSYKFTGTKADQTKQIGNSVPVELAAAHAFTLL